MSVSGKSPKTCHFAGIIARLSQDNGISKARSHIPSALSDGFRKLSGELSSSFRSYFRFSPSSYLSSVFSYFGEKGKKSTLVNMIDLN